MMVLENTFEQRLLALADDRDVAVIRRLAEGRVLAQALRFTLGVNDHRHILVLAPEHQLVEERLIGLAERRVLALEDVANIGIGAVGAGMREERRLAGAGR